MCTFQLFLYFTAVGFRWTWSRGVTVVASHLPGWNYGRRRKPNSDDLRDELGAINIGTWFLCVTDICNNDTQYSTCICNGGTTTKKLVSGSGISWAICKFPPWPRHITTPVSHHSVFLQMGCPSCRQTNSIKALKAETITQNKYNKLKLKLKPCLVTSYDIWPGNGAGLFWKVKKVKSE